MLTIDARAQLDLPRPFSDEEITDLIEAVIDDLDTRVIDPSVSTCRTDSEVVVVIEVSMTFDTDNPWIAQGAALKAMRESFDAAVPQIAGMTRRLTFQEA